MGFESIANVLNNDGPIGFLLFIIIIKLKDIFDVIYWYKDRFRVNVDR